MHVQVEQVSQQHGPEDASEPSESSQNPSSSSQAEQEPAWRRRISGLSAQISSSLYSAAPSLQRHQASVAPPAHMLVSDTPTGKICQRLLCLCSWVLGPPVACC